MRRALLAIAAVAAVAAFVVFVVRGAADLPDRPVPVAWDHATCGHCHMHVGEPRHAAQLVTTDGVVVVFDDAGCALAYLEARRPAIHRLWFHGEGDAWIAADDVGFVSAASTPMASGLLAVEASTPGARRLEELLR